MKQTADLFIVFLFVFIILAIRRIYRFWFGSRPGVKTKVPQKPTSAEPPVPSNLTINHNTMNILIIKDDVMKENI